MSPLLALVAGLVIAVVATRSARRSARSTELRLIAAHVARYPEPRARSRERVRDGDDRAAAYLAEAQESLEEELRKLRGERAPSLYTPEQARAAKAAMLAHEPMFGIRMTVKP